MIQLRPLPYDFKDLEPYISQKTIQFHYTKHQAGYVKTTDDLINQTPMSDLDLENLILTAACDSILTKLFNNSAQVWNHQFYWNSLTPDSSKRHPSSTLKSAIIRDFGTIDNCLTQLIETGINQFGSGWVWLVAEKGVLKIISTSNAQTPLTHYGSIPLLCLDVWEHAYYLDYQNNRKEYLTQIVHNLLNWDFVSQNYKKIDNSSDK